MTNSNIPSAYVMMQLRWFELLLLCVWADCVSTGTNRQTSVSSSSSSSSSVWITPPATPLVNNWEPSWVASLAQGTIIVALQCETKDDEKSNELDTCAVLLLVRSRRTEGNNQHEKENTSSVRSIFRLSMNRVMKAVDACHLYVNTGQISRWRVLSPSLFSAMTGFLPDVDYLYRRMRVKLDDYDTLYQSNAVERDNLDIASLAHSLGSWIREYSDSTSGRPLGIQGLLIGWTGHDHSRRVLRLYTTDPSGQIRSWNGGGAVIGRNSPAVRRNLKNLLLQQQQQNGHSSLTPDQALTIALKAVYQSDDGEKETSPHSSSDFSWEAILVWHDGRTRWMGYVDPNQIQRFLSLETTAI